MAYTEKQIIDEIRAIAEKLGKSSLTTAEWNKHSSISIGTVKSKFGAWNKAIEAAGLKPTDKAKASKAFLTISDSELLQDLLRLRNQFGKITYNLVDSKGKFSSQPYRKRWKSLRRAETEAIEKFNSGEINFIENETVESQDNRGEISSLQNDKSIGQVYGLSMCQMIEYDQENVLL